MSDPESNWSPRIARAPAPTPSPSPAPAPVPDAPDFADADSFQSSPKIDRQTDDADLAAALLTHRPTALGKLYGTYANRLYSYAVSLTGSRDQAADVVQDTMLLAFERIGQLRDTQRLRPWLYAICRNESLREIRRQRRHCDIEQVPIPSVNIEDFEADINADEATELVTQAMAGMSETDREVLELAIRHDLQADQIASALQISPSHARANLSRAKATLEAAVGALLLYRSASRSCLELRSMVKAQEFSPLLRKRIARHAGQCGACGTSRRRAVAAVAIASLPLIAAPAWLGELFSPSSQLVAAKLALAAGGALSAARPPFDREGWPTGKDDGPSRWIAGLVVTAALLPLIFGGIFDLTITPSERSIEVAIGSADMLATNSSTRGQVSDPASGTQPMGDISSPPIPVGSASAEPGEAMPGKADSDAHTGPNGTADLNGPPGPGSQNAEKPKASNTGNNPGPKTNGGTNTNSAGKSAPTTGAGKSESAGSATGGTNGTLGNTDPAGTSTGTSGTSNTNGSNPGGTSSDEKPVMTGPGYTSPGDIPKPSKTGPGYTLPGLTGKPSLVLPKPVIPKPTFSIPTSGSKTSGSKTAPPKTTAPKT